jgi:hypothetical protein
MVKNTAEIRVGRLVEVRISEGYRTAEDVDRLSDAMVAAVATLPAGQKHVTVADWMRCSLMTPVAVGRLTERMVATNARTERSALLAVTDLPVAVMQFLRVVRQAALPDRRLFFSATPLIQWLGEVLTPAESARLREFLAETPAPIRQQVSPKF